MIVSPSDEIYVEWKIRGYERYKGKIVKIEQLHNDEILPGWCCFMVVLDVTTSGISKSFNGEGTLIPVYDLSACGHLCLVGLRFCCYHSKNIKDFTIDVEYPYFQKIDDKDFKCKITSVKIDDMKDYLKDVGYFSDLYIDELTNLFLKEIEHCNTKC